MEFSEGSPCLRCGLARCPILDREKYNRHQKGRLRDRELQRIDRAREDVHMPGAMQTRTGRTDYAAPSGSDGSWVDANIGP